MPFLFAFMGMARQIEATAILPLPEARPARLCVMLRERRGLVVASAAMGRGWRGPPPGDYAWLLEGLAPGLEWRLVGPPLPEFTAYAANLQAALAVGARIGALPPASLKLSASDPSPGLDTAPHAPHPASSGGTRSRA